MQSFIKFVSRVYLTQSNYFPKMNFLLKTDIRWSIWHSTSIPPFSIAMPMCFHNYHSYLSLPCSVNVISLVANKMILILLHFHESVSFFLLNSEWSGRIWSSAKKLKDSRPWGRACARIFSAIFIWESFDISFLLVSIIDISCV